VLDRLGGVAWQSRKARLKQRIADMADRLIQIAAERAVRKGETLHAAPEGLYEEFCARFPYAETEDQLQAISDVIDDLSSGKPMDRLDLRRCRFRQDRGGPARSLRRGHVGQAGRGHRPDDPAGPPASPHLRRTLPGHAAHASAACPVWCGAKEAKATKEELKDGTRRHRLSARTRCWPRASSSRTSAC
jgi:transcription-repair coupling factor (superfamily II helicase)